MKVALEESRKLESCEVYHFRCRRYGAQLIGKRGCDADMLPTESVASRGGATFILRNDGSFGLSICSEKDAFSRERGRHIAYGRLMTKNTSNNKFWGRITPIPEERLDRMLAALGIANIIRNELPDGAGCSLLYPAVKERRKP